MILKSIKIVTLLVLANCSSLGAQQLPLSSHAESVADGRLGTILEGKIKNILESFGLKHLPHIRKASQGLLESEPLAKYSPLAKYGCYYINEDFFSTLSDEEIKASFAYNLYGPKIMQKRIYQKKDITMFSSLAKTVAFGSALTYINVKYSHMSSWLKIGYSVLATLPCIAAKYLALLSATKNDIYAYDAYVCKKANCKEGLQSLLTQLMIVAPESFPIEITKKRIAHLKQSN